jgi:hypothetical protein
MIKEYSIVLQDKYQSAEIFCDMLNHGWAIERVDCSDGTFIYILFREIAIET